ncbi:MAG: hypothetical protein JWN89_140 [Parcubacteria group bacterium]|nr:hypothetical protein [Parcubacteria group bacterium]
MIFQELLGVTAGVISFFAFCAYYISIIRGRTKPDQATWMILTIVSFLILVSYYSLGARDTLWLPASYTIGQLITFILSLKYGNNKWSTFDKICLALTLASLLVWVGTKSALYILLINIFIDFMGMLPTVRKSLLEPYSEARFPWLLTSSACLLNVFAIRVWSFDMWIYPIYMLIINGLVTILIMRLPISSKKF